MIELANNHGLKVAVIIPCFKVKHGIIDVISKIGPEVSSIYVVDDACPDMTGKYVTEKCMTNTRVKVLYNKNNLGVGGAVITGYRAAISDNHDILVKIDGDGQMNPSLISRFIRPIKIGDADYTKGNRFFNIEDVQDMPTGRLVGNAILSFVAKLSCGYWNVFDPTNGFTALHAGVAKKLPLDKISKRYFFESDMLFRLNCLRAKVLDIPMVACYGNEKSNMKIWTIIPEFFIKHLINIIKRIFYNYFLRNFSIASLELILGLVFITFGMTFGLYEWGQSTMTGIPATSGTVMLASLPIILGLQFMLAFINYDITHIPSSSLHVYLDENG